MLGAYASHTEFGLLVGRCRGVGGWGIAALPALLIVR